jgi:transposase
MAYKPLTDSQWALIEPHIPKQKMGRPRTRNREILEAILFVLSTNCRGEEKESRNNFLLFPSP